jgi:hypothetical protein
VGIYLEVEDLQLRCHNMITHNACSAIGAIEQINNRRDSTFDSAIIITKGEGILNNFMTELVEKCTAGYYIPKILVLTETQKNIV